MPKRVSCPHCHTDLRLPEELYEGPVQCPSCDGAFALRWRPRGMSRDELEEGTCTGCGCWLREEETHCPRCKKKR